MNINIHAFLKERYDNAMMAASGHEKPAVELPQEISEPLDLVIDYAERSKAVITVVLTSMVYKAIHPGQDIRLHQASIPNGYSGRTFDTTYITPFLKEFRFPAMAESGWLTRSLEHKVPYDNHYTGAIKPQALKQAFLQTIHYIETSDRCPDMFDYLLQSLIIQRDKKTISMARPRNLPIQGIVSLLDQHFHSHYQATGASRLPVLAIYAIYQCLFAERGKRYENKILLPLENHTSADTRSGRLGDIDVTDTDGHPFEAVEIKFDIPISHNIVVTAKEKIQPSPIKRYYILSTSPIDDKDKELIKSDINQIKNTHGCQLIVNGIMPTLKYYLRLLDDTAMFIDNYASLLESDKTIKFEHKQQWNQLVSEL